MTATRKGPVACCGTVVLDMFLHSPFAQKGQLASVTKIDYAPGGLASAVSIGLARLGLRVDALGLIGDDYFGQVLKDRLESAGVGIAGLRQSRSYHTALSTIIVAPDGERTVYFSSGANDGFGPESVDTAALSSCPICHCGYPCIMPAFRGENLAAFFRVLKSAGVVTSLDTTWSSSTAPLADIELALPYTDIFTPNLDEVFQLSGIDPGSDPQSRIEDAMEFFLRKGVNTVAVTLGRGGSFLAARRERSGPVSTLLPSPGIRVRCPAYETRGTLNATGAGDFFAAGFLAGLVHGVGPESALRAGALVAALHIEGSEIPPFERIVDLIEERPTLRVA